MQVNSNLVSNALAYYTSQKALSTNGNGDTAPRNQTETDASVSVDISDQARTMSFELKEYNANSHLKLDEAFFSKEARDQRRADSSKRLEESLALDPFDNEFQILGVKAVYSNGTLEKFITDSLEGKAKNASLVAGELGQMIRGAIHNPDATVEERAITRETALKIAEDIAKNYFTNPDEAKAFLNEINRFAKNDVLREKGYIVFDNSDAAPLRSYTSAVDGGVNWSEYAKKYGKSDIREIFSNPKELQSFVQAISINSKKWDNEIIKSFEENEGKVADIIKNVKETLNEADITNSLNRIMKAF